jgi:hypothetical protein
MISAQDQIYERGLNEKNPMIYKTLHRKFKIGQHEPH